MSKALSIVVIALAAVMIVILGFVFYLMITDSLAEDSVAEATIAPTEVIVEATEEESSTLPTAAIEVQPTNTLPPSPTPTETAPPTETPLPTETPVPPTNTPVSVIIPTNPPPPPPPPPTNTPEPAPPQQNTRGLVGTEWEIQWERTSPSVNGEIWYKFALTNSSGGTVPYGSLGAMPKKDGVDRPEWHKNSWGGNNDEISLDGQSAEDHIKLPEAGNYTLRLTICFESHSVCRAGQGSWVTLSHEIPIDIS